MKTPSDFAEERTPLYDGPCPVGHHELTKWIKERDSEQAASYAKRTELAREVLRDVGYGKEEGSDCGICGNALTVCDARNNRAGRGGLLLCRGFRARAALKALEGRCD